VQKNLLTVENLHASVDGKEILKGINLNVKPGEVHVLMGPNGAGKSTLANVLMGDPRYTVDKGKIYFEGNDITNEKTDVRARKGMFLSFQSPEEISGISVENFLRTAKSAYTGRDMQILAFRRELKSKMQDLDMDESYASRYLNVGFSGGEKKKSEILQLSVLNPKLAILDETDSGLDVDAVKVISKNILKYKNDSNSLIIITHITRILQDLSVDYVHVLADGAIAKTSDASLVEKISHYGFASVIK